MSKPCIIFILNIFYTLIFKKILYKIFCLICTTIIDYNQFPKCICLVKQTVNSTSNKCTLIICWHYY